MKIKTALITSAIILILSIGSIGTVVFFASQKADRIALQAVYAERLIEQVFELNMFGQDTIRHGNEERPRTQWYLQFEALNETLSSPVFTEEPSRSYLPLLQSDMVEMKRSFDALSENPALVQTNSTLASELSGDLLVKMQQTIADADALSMAAFQARSDARRRADTQVFALLGFLAVATLLILLFLSRRILDPLRALQRGVEIVTAGNLNHKVGRGNADEIGQLSRAFDAMTAKLLRSYATLEQNVKERTHEIEEMSERDRLLLASIGDGVVAIDRGWNIILFNPAASQLTGYTESEALGKPLRSIVRFLREKDRKDNIDFIEHAMATKELTLMSNHTILVRKDQTELPVGDSCAPVVDTQGEVTGAIIIFRDVTQEQVSAMMRSDFAYASHQLRTPISQALWAIDSVRAQTKEPALREPLVVAMRMIRSINKICSALLDISDIDQNRVLPRKKPVRIADLVAAQVAELKPIAASVGTKLRIGKIAKTVSVKSDRKLLARCLEELLLNAILYGNGKPVEVGFELRPGDLIIQIKDAGIGIRESDQPLVFTKFFRGGNVDTTNMIGAGLGLYITKAYLGMLGGRIWFESEEGKGTSFFISLPHAG